MLTTQEVRPLRIAAVEPSPFNLPPIIKDLAKHIANAADTAVEAYVAGRITDEPNITDRWIGAVEQALSNTRWRRRKAAAFCWQAKTLRASSGRAAEERRFGADLLGVAEIHVGDQCIHEGFLGQAKRVEPGTPMNSAEWRRLQEQEANGGRWRRAGRCCLRSWWMIRALAPTSSRRRKSRRRSGIDCMS